MATLPTPGGDTGTWGDELNEWLLVAHEAGGGPKNVYDVEMPPYNAVADEFFADGVTTATDATFTSATAAFTAGDVGKTVVIETGYSTVRPLHTTISSVTNSTTVELAHVANTTRTGVRFLISRDGDQTTEIQAAIDACAAAGGGVVYLPGPGYLVSGLVLKHRVHLKGAGRRATTVHLAHGANTMVIRNHRDATSVAHFVTVSDLTVDGAAERQTNPTVTLTAQWDAGVDSTLDLTAGQGAGMLRGGSLYHSATGNRFAYLDVSTDQLTGVGGGQEDTTDTTVASAQSLTYFKCGGIHLTSPSSLATTAESADAWNFVHDCVIRECKGYGIEMWSHSENRITNNEVLNCYECGIKSSYDSWINLNTVFSCGRAGFVVSNSSVRLIGNKSFINGSVTTSKGFGYLIGHAVIPAEGGVMMVGNEAQDNKAHGLYILNADRVSVTAMTLSSNGASGTDRHGLGVGDGTYVGLKLVGANYCLIDATSTEHGKNGASYPTTPGAFQVNALEIDSTSNHNQIRLTHGRGQASLNEVDFERAIKSTSDLSGGNHLVINAQEGATTVATIANTGTVTATVATNLLTRATHGLTTGDAVMFTTTTTLPAPLALNTVYYVIASGLTANDFKVSTTYNGTEVDLTTTGTGTHTMWEGYTPDPYKATTHRMTLGQTNTPIALPFRGHLGTRLILIIKQDGTGGRGATFHSSYITNGARVNDEPNSYTEIEFYYDGTSWLTTERVSIAALAANATANSTTTGVKISGLDMAAVGAGRYEFEYMLKYQSAATTTGVKFGVNHTGASSAIVATAYWPGVGTTAITVSDTDQSNIAFQLVGHTSTRSMTTTAPDLGPTTAVDTANVDNLVLIKGLLTVTNTGTLELWHASEVAAASTVQAGSMVRLTKLT